MRTLGSQPLTVPRTSAGTHPWEERFAARRVARIASQRIAAASRPRTAVRVNAGTLGTATFMRRNALPHMTDISPSSTQTVACVPGLWSWEVVCGKVKYSRDGPETLPGAAGLLAERPGELRATSFEPRARRGAQPAVVLA